MAEPICCDEPMIHNSFTGEWECSQAFFWLTEDGVLDEGGSITERVRSLYAEERLLHWQRVRVTDAALAAQAEAMARG